jgi:predicted alpha-1,6-mannanase (GH76 family)
VNLDPHYWWTAFCLSCKTVPVLRNRNLRNRIHSVFDLDPDPT